MTARIAVIPGDGIGPEVVTVGLKVLDAVGFAHERTEFDVGAERYLRTGETLPDSVLEELRAFDAILFGAVGDPRLPSGVIEQIILRLRWGLDLSVNLRPVRLYPGVPTPLAGKGTDDIDIMVVRENVEGIYVGAGGFLKKDTPDEVATQESVNTRRGVERVIRYAFDVATRRDRRLTLVHKTNVLIHAGDLWARTFAEVAEEYPDIQPEYMHADAACMFFVTQPERFDTVVTENLFGDILTDVGAAIAGGLGLAASANLNLEGTAPSLFEPVHGSAPDIAGQGKANPIATIFTVAMMLDHLGERHVATNVQDAAARTLEQLPATSGDKMGHSTSEIGTMVVAAL